MGKPILMYQLKSLLNEISWKFKEDTKIYAYDKTLFINLCLQPNLKREGQINLIYQPSLFDCYFQLTQKQQTKKQ